MADTATLAVLASVAESAGYVEKIISAIKTAKEVFGQTDKQQDETTKRILEAVVRAEASIKDELHTVELKKNIGFVKEASEFWAETWIYIVAGKSSFQYCFIDRTLNQA